jgi:Ca2+/Na+ antiporter
MIMFLSYIVYCMYMKYNEKVVRLITGETKVQAADDVEQAPGIVPSDTPGKAVVPVGGEGDGGTGGTGVTVSNSFCAGPEDSHWQSSDPTGHSHVLRSMKELRTQKTMDNLDIQQKNSKEICAVQEGGPQETSREEGEQEEEEVQGWRKYLVDPLNFIWEKIMPSPERDWTLFFMSIMNIGICTYIMVDAVNRSGCDLNVSPLIMGLIFLAAGTSVPDALGSIAVAQQGEGDMAVANALGSNVFDILLGLGVPWLITACMGREVMFKNATSDLLYWICILVAVLVLFLAALIFNKWKLNKTMGVILMTLYFIHIAATLLRALS